MDIDKRIEDILFRIGQDIVLHKLDDDNYIVEIDYKKYTAEILRAFTTYLTE